MQAQAVAHKQANMEAQSHAQQLAAKAQRHAQARMEAAAQVHHLKRVVQMGMHSAFMLQNAHDVLRNPMSAVCRSQCVWVGPWI